MFQTPKTKSNCFVAAILIWLRLGGRIHWEKPTTLSTFGHFCVFVNDRVIDFVDDYDEEEKEIKMSHWYNLLWYRGFVRQIPRKCFDRWKKNQKKIGK